MKKGMILMIALIIILIITITLTGVYTSISSNIASTYITIDRTRLFYSAESGVHYAQNWIKNLPSSEVNKIDTEENLSKTLNFTDKIKLDITVPKPVHSSGKNIWKIISVSTYKEQACTLYVSNIIATGLTETDNALTFTDTSSPLEFGNINFRTTNKLTVMGWIKWEVDPSTGSSKANIISNNSNSNSDDGQFWLQHSSNNNKFEFSLTAKQGNRVSTKSVTSSTTPVKDRWYHVAGVFNGKTLDVYVDGVKEGSISHKGVLVKTENDYMLTIGNWAYRDSRPFTGTVDELSIWTDNLTSSDIQTYMDSPPTGSEPHLENAWNFNEVSGNTVNDLERRNPADSSIGNNITRIANDRTSSSDGSGFSSRGFWEVKW